MMPLEQLRAYLLGRLQGEEIGSSQYQHLELVIGQIPQVATAQQLLSRLEVMIREQQQLVAQVHRMVEVSYLWDVWGYYPLERIEGPYQREKAYERMKELNSIVLPDGRKRPYTIVIVGGEEETRYQAIATRRQIQI